MLGVQSNQTGVDMQLSMFDAITDLLYLNPIYLGTVPNFLVYGLLQGVNGGRLRRLLLI